MPYGAEHIVGGHDSGSRTTHQPNRVAKSADLLPLRTLTAGRGTVVRLAAQAAHAELKLLLFSECESAAVGRRKCDDDSVRLTLA